jgi:RNA polymerase sigma factor for flagellar operon FliA
MEGEMATTTKTALQKYQKAGATARKGESMKDEKPIEKSAKLQAKAEKEAREAKEAKELALKEAKENAAAAKLALKSGKAGANSIANSKLPTKSVNDSSVKLEKALETVQSSGEKIKTEMELQKELEKELILDVVHSNKLVKGDFSPVNTNREKLIVEYAGLIKFIAQKIASRLPSNIELDDLISSGVIGLMDAIDKYDSSRDNKFKTYAEFRIRGAILDELRSQDWVPRSVREKAKILERAYAKIEQEKGRQANDDEVCIELGMTTEQYHEMLNEVRSVSLLSYDDLSNLSNADKRSLHGGENNSKVPTPFSEVSVAHLKTLVTDAIEDLPEKQRLVLSLYYYEDLNLKEIGRVLDVTESRVSQLHSQAILKLKARLKNNWDDFVSMVSA